MMIVSEKPEIPVHGVLPGLITGTDFFSHVLKSHRPPKKSFWNDVAAVVRKPYECAGYLLSDDKGACVDELCVVNKGKTFAEESRLGVVPVDHTEMREFYSVRDARLKKEMACFHCHPSVIRDVLGKRAPPSFEDGACLLSLLKSSDLHVVVGYTGFYVITKLNATNKSSSYRRWMNERTIRSRLPNARVQEVRELSDELREWQNTFDFDKGVCLKELETLRSMNFNTKTSLINYCYMYKFMFRGNLDVEFYPYVREIL